MRRISYGSALAAAVCLAAAAELAAPVAPGLLLTALLTLVIAQLPVPPRRRTEPPLTQRPPRSELDRHLERRARRREAD